MNETSNSNPPYHRILVPVDNSRHSDAALQVAAQLAQGMAATVVGFHVYAAQLHERRFLQMEPGLPERYQAGEDLQRQRSIHESLIAKGLRIISESYLERAREACQSAGVSFEGRLAEGRNYPEIDREARRGEYDLIVLGALGLGARQRSVIGSVCERVLRGVRTDVLVARDGQDDCRGVMVAIDGSPSAYRAIEKGLAIGAVLGEPVELVSVYDPQFHIVAFQRLASVLSEEAANLFRFKEQEQLHSEVIDRGLERLYRGYLEKGAELARALGQTVQTTVLAGKAFQSILDHSEKRSPRLLVAGRFGQHGTELSDIGSTTENLVRLSPCSVLVVGGGMEIPEDDPPPTEERFRLPWTPEAKGRLRGVSAFARAIVREAVERYAENNDVPEVTLEVMARARQAAGW